MDSKNKALCLKCELLDLAQGVHFLKWVNYFKSHSAMVQLEDPILVLKYFK